MKNAGYVNFGYNKDGVPNFISNPLPNHLGPKINGILESFREKRKTCVQNIITPMRVIFEKLLHARFLQSREEGAIKGKLNNGYCSYHAEVRRHDIQECSKF